MSYLVKISNSYHNETDNEHPDTAVVFLSFYKV